MINDAYQYIQQRFNQVQNDFYYRFNAGQLFSTKRDYINQAEIEKVNSFIREFVEEGKRIASDEAHSNRQLGSIALKIGQLYMIKGMIHSFLVHERRTSDTSKSFQKALQYIKRGIELSNDIDCDYHYIIAAVLYNELEDMNTALLYIRRVKNSSFQYKKLRILSEIMYNYCNEEKERYKGLMYDPKSKQIAGLSSFGNEGLFQRKIEEYYNLKYVNNDERWSEIKKIRTEIEKFALNSGRSVNDAHDVLCRSIYITSKPFTIIRKGRALFWYMYGDETLEYYFSKNA